MIWLMKIFEDLEKRTAADKVLRDKVFNYRNSKYDGCQRALASMVYKFFYKKSKTVVLIKILNKLA